MCYVVAGNSPATLHLIIFYKFFSLYSSPAAYTQPMPHITPKPGSFCWIELATTDQKAAKDFYTSLFGWGVEDSPMGPEEYYSIFKLQGRDTAAACTLRKDQGNQPYWGIYMAVENADASAKKAEQLGGEILAPPF